MPAISVIVPVYNAEKYLPACVDSILAQSWSDFEVILVDDGSPDSCPELCEDYARRDSRVHVIHQENQGQAAARNNAVRLAQGEWVCFVDSDDLIHPQTLELLYRAAIEGNVSISTCGHVAGTDPEEIFYGIHEFGYEFQKVDENALVELYDQGKYPCWVVWAKLIRRNIVLKYPFCEGRFYEDNAIVCYWYDETERIAQIPAELYFYRTNPDSVTNCKFNLKRMDYLWALEEIIHFCTSKKYMHLRERFCERYLFATVDFRIQVLEILGRKDVAKKMKWDAVRFLRKEKVKFVTHHTDLFCRLWFPRFTALRELIQIGADSIRNDGIKGFFMRTMAFFRKGVKE